MGLFRKMMALGAGLFLAATSVGFTQSAVVASRPSYVDLSSTTAEGAVKMTISSYPSDDARYRLYSGGNQYNCWDAVTNAYITSTSYSSGPAVPGQPSVSSTFWILYQRGNNNAVTASYRDRLGTAYSSNYQTVALPATSTAITTALTLSATVVGSLYYPTSTKYVVLGYDAASGGNLICACATSYQASADDGTFSLVFPDGVTIQRVEIRTVDDVLIKEVTGSYSATTDLGSITLDAPPTSDDYTVIGTSFSAADKNYADGPFEFGSVIDATNSINITGVTVTSGDGLWTEKTGNPTSVTGGTTETLSFVYTPTVNDGAVSTATVLVETDGTPSSFTVSLSGSTVIDISIADFRALAEADNAGTKIYRMSGYVNSSGQFSSIQVGIQDRVDGDASTLGITVYDSANKGRALIGLPEIGEMLTVTGTSSPYKGLLEIKPTVAWTTTTEAVAITPVVTTMAAMGDDTESVLVTLSDVAITSGTYSSTTISGADDGSGTSIGIYLDSDTGISFTAKDAPLYVYDVTGIGGQNDSANLPSGGTAYQLMPRFLSDFFEKVTPVEISEFSLE